MHRRGRPFGFDARLPDHFDLFYPCEMTSVLCAQRCEVDEQHGDDGDDDADCGGGARCAPARRPRPAAPRQDTLS
eukprot:5634189-Pleurochrysis_carterae.AAC.2